MSWKAFRSLLLSNTIKYYCYYYYIVVIIVKYSDTVNAIVIILLLLLFLLADCDYIVTNLGNTVMELKCLTTAVKVSMIAAWAEAEAMTKIATVILTTRLCLKVAIILDKYGTESETASETETMTGDQH